MHAARRLFPSLTMPVVLGNALFGCMADVGDNRGGIRKTHLNPDRIYCAARPVSHLQN